MEINTVYSPVIHPKVDKRIDHGIRHCQPIERQVHMLNIVTSSHSIIVINVDKVAMVRQPAQGENCKNYDKHPNHLRTKANKVE